MDNIQEPIAYLKKTSKEIVISQLKTGDLVKVKSEKTAFIYHYGIVIRENNDFYIYHNDPDRKNKVGGNIIKDNFLEWVKGREIVEVTSMNIDNTNIEEIVDQLKHYKYDLIYFNCEHFVNLVRKTKNQSPQIMKWTLGIVIITILVVAFKNSNYGNK